MGISIFTINSIISIGIVVCLLIDILTKNKNIFFGAFLVGLCALDVFIKALSYSPICLGVSILVLALTSISLGLIIARKGKTK